MAPENQFGQMSTAQLAAESLARARDEREVSDAAFDALGPAYLATIPVCITATLTFAGWLDDWRSIATWLAFVNIPAIAVAFPFMLRWHRAIRKCRAFTAEMNARRRELERRNSIAKAT